MRRFRAIVQTPIEPEDRHVLWLQRDALTYYNNGEWVPILVSPEVGELVEQINTRIDKNLWDEVTSMKEELLNLIEKELDLYRPHILLKDKSTISKQEYQSISGTPETPVYAYSNGYLYKVFKITRDENQFTVSGIRVKDKDDTGITLSLLHANYTIILDETGKDYIVNESSSYVDSDNFVLPSKGNALDIIIRGAGYTDSNDFVDRNSHSYFIDLTSTNQDCTDPLTDMVKAVRNNKIIKCVLRYNGILYRLTSIDVSSKKVLINTTTDSYEESGVTLSGASFTFDLSPMFRWIFTTCASNSITLKTVNTPGSSDNFLSEDGSYHSLKLKTINNQSLLGEGNISFNMDLYLVVSALPNEGDPNKIYLLPEEEGTEGNLYTEYAYINNKWEVLGTYKANVNLTSYMKKSDFNSVNVPSEISIEARDLDVAIHHSSLEAGNDGILVESPQDPWIIPVATPDKAGVMSKVDKDYLNILRDFKPTRVDDGGFEGNDFIIYNTLLEESQNGTVQTVPMNVPIRAMDSGSHLPSGLMLASDKKKLDKMNTFYIRNEMEPDEYEEDVYHTVLKGAEDVGEYLKTHDQAPVFIYLDDNIYGSGIAIKQSDSKFVVTGVNYDIGGLSHIFKVTFTLPSEKYESPTYIIDEDNQISSGADIPLATLTTDGLMSAADKRLWNSLTTTSDKRIVRALSFQQYSNITNLGLNIYERTIKTSGIYEDQLNVLYFPKATSIHDGVMSAEDKKSLDVFSDIIKVDGFVTTIWDSTDTTDSICEREITLSVDGYEYDGADLESVTRKIHLEAASANRAGVMTTLMFNKLNTLDSGATADSAITEDELEKILI